MLNDAIEVGTPVLRDSVATNRRLRDALRELDDLVSQPTTKLTLQRLEETIDIANPLVKWVAPAQTVCNYWNYWFTFLPNAFDRDQVGYAFRQILTGFPPSPEVEASPAGYAGVQSSGRESAALGGKFKPYELPITNAHPYQPTGQKNADCQGGQFGYELGSGRVPGQALKNPAYGVSDLPGSRGPTLLFYNEAGDRELRDTRIASRQPETWEGIGG